MSGQQTHPPALTLQRPWGWAIVHAGKDVENRSWPTRYRGPIFVHQGKGKDRDARWCKPLRIALDRLHPDQSEMAGAVLGWVTLAGCHQGATGCCRSEWAMPDQWHWELTAPRALVAPVPTNGALGLWRPRPELLDAIRAVAP